MTASLAALIIVIVVVGFLALTLHVVHQYEKGVVFRFGRVVAEGAGTHLRPTGDERGA